MNYDEIVKAMTSEYLSNANQLKIKGTVETLRMESFTSERNTLEVSEGLSKMGLDINELVPQCHPDFRSDAYHLE